MANDTRKNIFQIILEKFKSSQNKGIHFHVGGQEELLEKDITIGTDNIVIRYTARVDGVKRRISVRGENHVIYFDLSDRKKTINGCTFWIDESKQTIQVNFSDELKTKGGSVEFDVVLDGIWKTSSRHKEDGYKRVHVVLTVK